MNISKDSRWASVERATSETSIRVEWRLDGTGGGQIRNAGALFLGKYTPPAVADYVAGPNHVLPTNGSARFFSALSVNDFVKRTNIVSYDREGLQAVKPYVTRLANMEGLQAHARSMESRAL